MNRLLKVHMQIKLNVASRSLLRVAVAFFFLYFGGKATASCESLISHPPLVMQLTDYSCGPACVRSLFLWKQKTTPNEEDLRRIFGTTVQWGTHPQQMINGFSMLGYSSQFLENLSLQDLESYINSGFGVMALVTYEQEAHWVLVYEISARVHVMDPWYARLEIYRKIPLADFVNQWFGKVGTGTYEKSALVVEMPR